MYIYFLLSFLKVVDSTSIKMIGRSFASVMVQWAEPQDSYDTILHYQFHLQECETNNWTGSPCRPVQTQLYKSNSNSPYFTLGNLSPFTTYTLKMAAHSGGGLGPYSNPVVVQTVQKG